jgi:hypothetical protein
MYYRGVAPAVAPVPKALLIIAVSLLQSEKLRAWAHRGAVNLSTVFRKRDPIERATDGAAP